MRKTANSEENTAESMLQYDMEETMWNEVKSEKELLMSIVFFFFWMCICTAPGIIARNFAFSFQNTLEKQWTAVRVMKQASLLNTV